MIYYHPLFLIACKLLLCLYYIRVFYSKPLPNSRKFAIITESNIFGWCNMNRLFYLFSESVKLEAIYLCEDEEYIDKPKLKTGVYPMGTLLSRAIYLLSPWYAENLNLAKKDEIIALTLNTSPDYESSFSYIVYEDSVAQIVFEMLIKNQEYKLTQVRFDKSNTELEKILNYIQELQGNTFESTAEKLIKKLNRLGYISPKHNLYYTEKQDEKSENKNASYEKSFNPSTVRKSKPLFKLDETQPVETLYEELELPICVTRCMILLI